MADDNCPLKDYVVPTDKKLHFTIVHPTVGPTNFETKPSLVGMVQQNQFFGLPTENSNLHLSIFMEFYDTLKLSSFKPSPI